MGNTLITKSHRLSPDNLSAAVSVDSSSQQVSLADPRYTLEKLIQVWPLHHDYHILDV